MAVRRKPVTHEGVATHQEGPRAPVLLIGSGQAVSRGGLGVMMVCLV